MNLKYDFEVTMFGGGSSFSVNSSSTSDWETFRLWRVSESAFQLRTLNEYVTDLVHKAQEKASKRGKLLPVDFLHLIRKDKPKLHGCKELLSMHEELKQARKAFELDEEKLATTTD